MQLRLVRTNSGNSDFLNLVAKLDADLKVRDGDEHAFYAQLNKTDTIRYAIVAYLDKQPVGCGAIRQFADDTMEVKRMFVPETQRGKGIASVILAELENWARELQFKKCVLETGMRQPEAIRLYEKNGYRVIPNYGKYKDVYNSVCFEKELTPVN